MQRQIVVLSILIFLTHLSAIIEGHGVMLDPPGRSSRWRFNASAPVNYYDDGLHCGGYQTHWFTNDGKCGFCGDDYTLERPRPNELGGFYGGVGVITKTYSNISVIQIGFDITANHLGYIYLHLCNLDKVDAESEECFQQYRLKFSNGSDKFYINETVSWLDVNVVLPTGLSCEHCVLRWIYNSGNFWGTCEDGGSDIGCGAQETFITCADISISNK